MSVSKVSKEVKKINIQKHSEDILLDFLGSHSEDKKDSKVFIFCHSSPDPDCMASALAMRELCNIYGLTSVIYYGGEINHTQNKAMMNVLDIPMRDIGALDPELLEDLKKEIYNDKNIVVIIDTSHFYGSGNCGYTKVLFDNEKPAKVDVIIDHHEETAFSEKTKININKKVGSCSTIFVNIFETLSARHLEEGEDYSPLNYVSSSLATALYLGLMKDTDELNAKHILTEADENAYSILKEKIDFGLYLRIINCPKPRILIDLEGVAKFKYINQKGNCVVSGVGFIKSPHRALIAEICDDLMTHDQVEKCVVLGIVDDGIGGNKYLVASFRSTGDVVDADKFIKKIFGKDGSGGRKGAAGANIVLDQILSKVLDVSNEESRERLFEAIYRGYANSILQEIEM